MTLVVCNSCFLSLYGLFNEYKNTYHYYIGKNLDYAGFWVLPKEID